MNASAGERLKHNQDGKKNNKLGEWLWSLLVARKYIVIRMLLVSGDDDVSIIHGWVEPCFQW